MNNDDEDQGITITPELTSCGCVSYWRLSGSIERFGLVRAWESEGLDPKLLPDPPEPEAALRRAVEEVVSEPASGKRRRRSRRGGVQTRMLVRPLAKRGAWAVVREEVDGEHYVGSSEELVVRWNGTAVVVEPSYDSRAFAIRDAFGRHREMLSSDDVSSWLVKLAEKATAQSLRETGGVYFVPRGQVEFWRAAVRAIKASSGHRVYKIPAMKNDEAVEAILDAVTAEAEREAATMLAELAAEGDEALGLRALRTRGAQCESTLAKVAAYEDLLGVKMDALKERLVSLRASVAAATLTVQAESDKEAA